MFSFMTIVSSVYGEYLTINAPRRVSVSALSPLSFLTNTLYAKCAVTITRRRRIYVITSVYSIFVCFVRLEAIRISYTCTIDFNRGLQTSEYNILVLNPA